MRGPEHPIERAGLILSGAIEVYGGSPQPALLLYPGEVWPGERALPPYLAALPQAGLDVRPLPLDPDSLERIARGLARRAAGARPLRERVLLSLHLDGDAEGQGVLAARLGAARESVTKEVGILAAKGWVEKGYRRVALTERGRAQALRLLEEGDR
ncbi:hypothetical protein [Calidithermus chliarophilus]|uniref:hypothetical protein n=1 Tax=Calidithermus chliarophilus TaxID=52023 RepID=UPI0004137BD9|nr:hypothetical protein [Calidithermus chliarophilus]